MNKNQVTQNKRAYAMPAIRIISTPTEQLLQQGSRDHQHIGQGGTAGDTKRSFLFEDEEEDNSWDTYTP